MGFSYQTLEWIAFIGLILGAAAFWNSRVNAGSIEKLWDKIDGTDHIDN